MAQIHNAIRRAKALQRAINNALGVDAAVDGVERFSETLQPTIDVWSRPEWSWLRDENLSTLQRLQAAVAAEFGLVGVFNPVNSGRICVVEAAYVQTPSGAAMAFMRVLHFTEVATYSTANALNARDTRLTPTSVAGGGAPILAVDGTDPALAAGNVIEQVETTSGTNYAKAEMLPVVLHPGRAYVAEHSVVNLSIRVKMAVRHRAALSGELPPAG